MSEILPITPERIDQKPISEILSEIDSADVTVYEALNSTRKEAKAEFLAGPTLETPKIALPS